MLSKEEKKAIEYYSNKEVSFSVDFDTEKLLKALGITEEDSFENHQIRFKTLLNLITKLQKENEILKRAFDKQTADMSNNLLELRQKDKQIDLMAEMIDELSEYYTRYNGKNNEFCKEVCIKKDIDCIDCIKQYFEIKAKKGE